MAATLGDGERGFVCDYGLDGSLAAASNPFSVTTQRIALFVGPDRIKLPGAG